MRYLRSLSFIVLFTLNLGAANSSTNEADLTARIAAVTSSLEAAEKTVNELHHQTANKLLAEDYIIITLGYQTLGNREAALEAIIKAENLADTPYVLGLILYTKARIYGIQFQDAPMAQQQLALAEQQLTNLTDPAARLLLSDVLNSFASAYNLQGDLKNALHYAQRSLVLSQKLGNQPRELNALILSGRIALQNNQYRLAFAHLQQGLSLATQLNDQEQLASIHFRLGMAHRKLDQHTDALFHFEQAAERYLQLDRMPNYSYVLVYIAETYLENPERIEDAEAILMQALDIAQSVQNMTRAATVYYSLGRAAMLKQSFAESEQHYLKALQHFRQINSRTLALETSLALVQLFIQQERNSDAAALLAEMASDIDSAATFLQLRYARSAAQLAAANGDWQQAYHLQEKVTSLNQQELADQIQHNVAQLKEGLNQVSDAESKDNLNADLLKMLSAAQKQQALFKALLVLMIFITFIIWQLYRRQQTKVVTITAPDKAPRQWSLFQDRIKSAAQQHSVSLMVLLPRFKTRLQQQYGQNVVTQLLRDIEQELDATDIITSYSGTEALWLAVATKQTTENTVLLQRACELLQQKLRALAVEPAILSVELELTTLLGNSWHKDDLNALPEAVWFGWFLAEKNPAAEDVWHLTFSTLHNRPCEWQAENLRMDMLNACRLGELTLMLNKQPITVQV